MPPMGSAPPISSLQALSIEDLAQLVAGELSQREVGIACRKNQEQIVFVAGDEETTAEEELE